MHRGREGDIVCPHAPSGAAVAELGQARQTQDHHAGTCPKNGDPTTTQFSRSNVACSQDRPDLIESELSGLAFDSNQQIFKTAHIDIMFSQNPPTPVLNEAVYTFIDPAAGGPQSDYAVVSVTRQKGMLTVRKHTHESAA